VGPKQKEIKSPQAGREKEKTKKKENGMSKIPQEDKTKRREKRRTSEDGKKG